ncbi:MAG: NAD(P)-dependent oxidoreductase [Armatimonadota bacterium]|nr:NAD(P)-dependent oxidoreductase [Armatimonadota bacterium]
MRVLVTGGSGLVGRYVVRELAEAHEVTILDINPPTGDGPYQYIRGDVLSSDEMVEKLAGQDAVIHLAGIPGEPSGFLDHVYYVNTQGTFNVLEGCARNSINNFVFASSDSAYGFVFHKREMLPDYLPLDENHPLRPQDGYGLSKLVGEEICKAYARRYGIKTTSIRPCWVWCEEEREIQRDAVRKPGDWWNGMWAYVEARDCAQAFRLAIENTDEWDHEAFVITADDNGAEVESRELIARYYPKVANIAPDLGGYDTLLSNAKAKRILGYRPEYKWRDFLRLEETSEAHTDRY